MQATPSSQFGAVPAWQPVETLHTSGPLHHAPSSQAALFGTWLQESIPSLHESAVHAMPSSQFGRVPDWHPAVALQTSAPLQYCPSLQAASLGKWSQERVPSSHESVVQATPSSQSAFVWQS